MSKTCRKARVTCTDGTVYECDALVGADGLHSKIRKAVMGDVAPVCSEYVAYRGTAPIDKIRATASTR